MAVWALGGPVTLQADEGDDRSPIAAQEKVPSFVWGKEAEAVRLGLGYAVFGGESSWRIGFSDSYGRSASTLDFNDQRGGLSLFSLEISHPRGRVSVSLEGGLGHGSGGKGTDTDFLGGMTYFQSRFETSAETTYWVFDLRTSFSSLSEKRWVLSPFLGWVHYTDEIRLCNGAWTRLYGQSVERPFSGLDSRYTFQWDAFRLGLKGEGDLTTPNPQGIASFRLNGHLALFPFARYRGTGIWNLRDDFKQDPSFSHEAGQGGLLGVDAGLSLVYRPLPWLEWEGGGRLFYFYINSGKDKTYFSNGATVEIDLEEVMTFRAGVFVKMTGRF